MIFIHKHQVEAVAVESSPRGGLFATALPVSTTTILWRCCCGHVESTTIAGRWTLAQVRGEEPTKRQRIEADLAVSEAREEARA